MKIKRVLAMLLAVVMTVSLAACGGGNSSSGETKAPDQTKEKTTQAPEGETTAGNDGTQATAGNDGEIYNIVMTIATLGAEPSGLADVEKAINDIVGPAIGVNVTLYPIFISDLNSQINLMITSGDKLDLILNFLGTMPSLVDKGALLPLDDLYAQYGQDIEKAEGIAMAGGFYNGNLYAVPSEEKWARRYGFAARTDIVQELGFEYDEEKTYTLDDLEELFKAYKEKYGDGYYCISGTASNSEFYGQTHPIDYLGGNAGNGVLMGAGLDGDTTVTNLFGTEEYKEFAKRMYRWAQAGYFSPDASTNTDAGTVQVQSGYYLGGFQGTETDMKSNVSRDCGYDMTMISLTDKYAATHMYQVSTWSIPTTCENPEKTFRFLNMLYGDNDLDNILTNGLEGISYEWVEKGEKAGQGVMRYADGVDAANTPYTMPLHVFGDKLSIGIYEPLTLDYYKVGQEFNESITEDQKSCTLGYVFNASSVATQKAAVDAVIQQYSGILSTGAQDPDTILPEFITALEDAGIKDIMDENQAQLDEWLAANGK